jgi:hypothetical protein
MKSVGEAMAIGRNFTEALQKALRFLEQPEAGLRLAPASGSSSDKETLPRAGAAARTTAAARWSWTAIRAGASPEEIFEVTRIDPWFVDQLALDQRGRRPRSPAAPELTPDLLPAGQAARFLRRPARQDPRDDRPTSCRGRAGTRWHPARCTRPSTPVPAEFAAGHAVPLLRRTTRRPRSSPRERPA